MRPARFAFAILLLVLSSAPVPISAQQPNRPIVLVASTVLDGKGNTLTNLRITIDKSKIVSIGPNTGAPIDYDLRGLTVLPGWIDAHVHITWIFGDDGKNAGSEGKSQNDAYKAADGESHG
jgi:imidazolonepropionase-like amidohydrolase